MKVSLISNIQSIDARNTELEKEIEKLKIERITEKNEQNTKFESDKEKLIAVANELEVSLENLRKELEESEERASDRLGI